jgi:uncharacterized protein (TIGR02001 family)
MKFNKLSAAVLATLALGSTAAYAQLSTNVGLTSDYRFRGISQSNNGAAVQGGIDYAHSSGLYVGNWNSSVSSTLYPNSAGLESNLYAGWKKDVYRGLTVDVGSYNYFYLGKDNSTDSRFNTQELYAGLGYGPLSLKYSQSLSNYFGINNSVGTSYMQADIKQSLGPVSKSLRDLSVVAHYGQTTVANNSNFSYNDMNVGIAYALTKGWDLGVRYYTNTSASNALGLGVGSQLYKDAVVGSITYTFK